MTNTPTDKEAVEKIADGVKKRVNRKNPRGESVTTLIRRLIADTPERMTAYINDNNVRVAKTGCMIWTGYVCPEGYGRASLHSRGIQAHRLAYEVLRGPIADGLHLDHLCRVRSCINPDHLEAVTCKENILRGVGATARNANRTQCKWGHDLPERRPGSRRRRCEICQRASEQKSRAKNRRLANG